MKQTRLFLYWLLLLVPALLIGGTALRLLQRERERLDQAVLETTRERVETLAATLILAVQEVEDELLRQIPAPAGPDPAAALVEWRNHNPLVRNVFIWSPAERLLFPAAAGLLNAEERRFVHRYDGLFSGRVPWGPAPPDAAPQPPAAGNQQLQYRRDLLQTAQQAAPVAIRLEPQAASEPPVSEWLPWFWENRLFMLGWVRPPNTATIHGLELELMVLLSRLVALLPAEVPPQQAYALCNGSGQILHQAGSLAIGSELTPRIRVPLGPALPHWEVAFYAAPGALGAPNGASFLLPASLLVGVFVLAILSGGGLLLLQARRNALDARRKTSFVSSVSHELKTPLTSIRMYAELLMEKRVTDPTRQERYLNVIVSESQRLTRLVNNVLDFSRLEQGRKRYRLETLDAAAILRELLEAQQMRLDTAGMRAEYEPEERPVMVRADRDALEQILINLIDNAIKYAGGGGELRLEAEPGPDAARIRVMDRGPGIAERDRETIFRQFYRRDDSLTATQTGTGLGLTLARHMARDVGGNLICRSRDGGGTVFELTLPSPASNSRDGKARSTGVQP